jgi:hypothetical protein
MRFQALVAVSMKMAVFWDVMTLMIEAASSSEMLVNIYETTQSNILENNHLHTCTIYII